MTCCTSQTPNLEAKPALALTSSMLPQFLAEAQASDLPVRIKHGNWELGAGFHITEIKRATIRGLDCGKNEEAWEETVIQLLDLPGPEEQRMKSGKLAAIIGHRELIGEMVLEVSKPGEALALFSLAAVEKQEGALVAHLVPRTAQCKPYVRSKSVQIASSQSRQCISASSSACCA